MKLSETTSRLAAIGAGDQRHDRLGLILGCGALAAVASADIALGADVVLAGTYVIAPFIAAIWAGLRVTGAVALLAVIGAVLSGEWNTNYGTTDYDARLALVVGCGALALASAWARERARASTRRVELLNSVGEVADGSLPLAETLERVLEVIVPALADFCMVDAIHDRRVIRSAVRAAGAPEASAVERYLMERGPTLPDWMTRPDAPFPRHPRFIPRMNDEDLRRLSHDASDLHRLRSLALRSTITVSMIARDRVLGALTLCTAWSGRRYSALDVRFARALAGRVALALDNAGLFSDLESVERRMDSVMSMLDEAVVIHDSQGELVFANPSARRMMGLAEGPDAAGVWEESVRAGLVIRAEDGTLLPPEELVGRRVLRDGRPATRVLRVMTRGQEGERWLITRAKPIMGPEGPLYSVTAIEDVTEVKRAELDQRLLARTGELLASARDHHEMLEGVAQLAVPEFADWCAVEVPGTEGEFEQIALAHSDPEMLAHVQSLRDLHPARVDDVTGPAEVMRTNEAKLIHVSDELIERRAKDAEHAQALRRIGLRSVIRVPMTVGGRVTGVVSYATGEGSRRFDDRDLALAVEIGRRAGIAAENARLAAERAAVAQVLQQGLMPPALPHMPGWETAAVYQPAGEVNEVGGDFYDAFEIDGGWMVVMGDVAGRGARAASLTALARHTIRTAGMLTGDPRVALALLDGALRERGESALCTVAILILPEGDDDSVTASITSAGHPLPLLIRDGEVSEVGKPGPLLGAFEGSEWEPAPCRLQPSDQLVLFTDGVIEARGPRDRFGEERLRAELCGADRPLTAVGKVTAALEAFIGGEPEDDVALIAVRRAQRRLAPQAGERQAIPA